VITTLFTDEEFAEACSHDVIGSSLYGSWNTRLLLLSPRELEGMFFVQRSDGKISAAISLDSDTTRLCVADGAGLDELRAFLNTAVRGRIECLEEAAAGLALNTLGVRYIQQISLLCGDKSAARETPAVRLEKDELESAYELLKSAGFGAALGDFKGWQDEALAAMYKGTGELYGIFEGGELLATAAVRSRTARAAFLGNVAVREDRRGTGLGRQMLLGALTNAGTPLAELLCEEHNRGFYKKCGFAETGRVVLANCR
jgi:GNAT superfamily N-acetyltransferase